MSFAQENAEQAKLVSMLRELDLMQSIASQKAPQSIQTQSRYYFDYFRSLVSICK